MTPAFQLHHIASIDLACLLTLRVQMAHRVRMMDKMQEEEEKEQQEQAQEPKGETPSIKCPPLPHSSAAPAPW